MIIIGLKNLNIFKSTETYFGAPAFDPIALCTSSYSQSKTNAKRCRSIRTHVHISKTKEEKFQPVNKNLYFDIAATAVAKSFLGAMRCQRKAVINFAKDG